MADIIPVFHCFDENYVLPAAVAFDSMLRRANRLHEYKLYVSGAISSRSQTRLIEIVDHYPHASLEFLGEPHDFSDLFRNTKTKAHFTPEMFHKMLVAELLPDHDRAIISDVDVVWLDDISAVWDAARDLGDAYLAGVRGIAPPLPNWLHSYNEAYTATFTSEEIASLQTNACLWIFDLKRMRSDGMTQRFLEFAQHNAHRLRQPEQDVINLVTAPHHFLLPARSMVCNYFYEFYPNLDSVDRDRQNDVRELRDAFTRPVQLHFPGGRKPWSSPSVTASAEWFRALALTPFLDDWLKAADTQFVASRSARSATRLLRQKLRSMPRSVLYRTKVSARRSLNTLRERRACHLRNPV